MIKKQSKRASGYNLESSIIESNVNKKKVAKSNQRNNVHIELDNHKIIELARHQ